IRRNLPRDLLLRRVHADANHLGRHDVLEPGLRRDEEEPSQRDDPNQVTAFVDDVQVERHLVPAELLDRVYRFGGGGVFRESEYPRIHDATRGPFGIFENFGNPRGRLLTTHQLADFVGKRPGETIDQRRGIVWRQFLKEADDVPGWAQGQR